MNWSNVVVYCRLEPGEDAQKVLTGLKKAAEDRGFSVIRCHAAEPPDYEFWTSVNCVPSRGLFLRRLTDLPTSDKGFDSLVEHLFYLWKECEVFVVSDKEPWFDSRNESIRDAFAYAARFIHDRISARTRAAIARKREGGAPWGRPRVGL